jgi:hypothetical protein
MRRVEAPHSFRKAPASGPPLDLAVAEAADQVIVHHADGLHVRVDDRRADEGEAALLEILAERVGFR